jgi:ABC-type amino acid transport substrate-binding protein
VIGRAVLLLSLLLGSPALAQKVVVAGTHVVPPFVIRDADGGWSGISIDLWKRIAADLGWQVEFRDVPVKELVSGQREDLDVII